MKHELNLGVRTWLHLNRVRFKVEKHLTKHLEHYDLPLIGILNQTNFLLYWFNCKRIWQKKHLH
ncbi:hypothetical protein Krac_7081 [Ktedonobacter racemifer DSM 44963]|uniref:Uncharacterized protein n=1 Tax=Ktedonobacter racemifer DSM 44963 TaxID=485913 RepID=D6TQW3_KTERA|nr:hypothetical protein Krac_7081 [Ktedonobacter racemifer DSM 44963]